MQVHITCLLIVPRVCCSGLVFANCLKFKLQSIFAMCWVQSVSWWRWQWKCTPLDQFSLACFSAAKHHSFFHSCFLSTGGPGPGSQLSVTGCVEVKNIGSDSDSGVYTPEEHFPKLSPCSAPLGIGGWIKKSVSEQACRGAGMVRGRSGGNSQAEPLKCEGGKRQEGEGEDFGIGAQLRDCGLEEKFDLGPRE